MFSFPAAHRSPNRHRGQHKRVGQQVADLVFLHLSPSMTGSNLCSGWRLLNDVELTTTIDIQGQLHPLCWSPSPPTGHLPRRFSVQVSQIMSPTGTEHSFTTTLPVEILNKIVSHVDEIKPAKRRFVTLQACTLVCRHFREISRPLFHSKVYINYDWDCEFEEDDFLLNDESDEEDDEDAYCEDESSALSPSTTQVLRLFENHPDVVPHVRNVCYTMNYEDGNIPGLAQTLSRLQHVRSLTLNGSRLPNLIDQIPKLYDAFLCLISLPSLSHLRLDGFSRLPMSNTLPRFSGIDSLEILRVSFNSITSNFYGPVSGTVLGSYQHIGPKRLAISDITSPHASILLPRLNLDRLEELSYTYMHQEDLAPITRHLKDCMSLRSVTLEVRYGEFTTWAGLSTLAHAASLRYLRLECNPFVNHSRSLHIPASSAPPASQIAYVDIFQGLIPEIASLQQIETLDLRICLPNDFIMTSMRTDWQTDSPDCVWARFAGSLASIAKLRRVVVTLVGLINRLSNPSHLPETIADSEQVVPAGRRCLIENRLGVRVHLTHVVDQSLIENKQIINSIEWNWGMPKGALDLDTMDNIFFLGASMHEMYKNNNWALLPEEAVVRQFLDDHQLPLWRSQFPKFQVCSWVCGCPPGLHKNTQPSTFRYTLLPLKDMEEVCIYRQDTSDSTAARSDVTVYNHPYHSFPVITSHIHPKFVILWFGHL
ncbi:hypothetical protein CVT24_010722 [Panaeolus cyanescens]|uniref:Uncharacterized protein n=1 Tax=Panaeolus cyanescens TaxID=181874 RepID=A0A409YW07_9AGAR|nr:hypothetical protein CVT24_010722 [Panaeolus cyanescens]